ncbi:MAG: hypothetical protein J7L62_02600 [Candidatus Aminicenantes bacterium]|nr:hypothetical protein [Candidatus Aminicenantes bacterium]
MRKVLIFLTLGLYLLYSSPDIFGKLPEKSKGLSGHGGSHRNEYTLAGIVYSNHLKCAFFLHKTGKYLVLKEGQGKKSGLKIVRIEKDRVEAFFRGKKKIYKLTLKGGKNVRKK